MNVLASFDRKALCDIQMTNNTLLAEILRNNHSCAFYRDRSISFLSFCDRKTGEYESIDEFQEKVPLTTYEDYHSYVNRIVENGEQNVLTPNKIAYFITSSGTTGRKKMIPRSASTIKSSMMLSHAGFSKILMSLPSVSSSPKHKSFFLTSGKRLELFQKSKNGTPIGPFTLWRSAIPCNFIMKLASHCYDLLSYDLIEEIQDFETCTFVQLVFALAIPDIRNYVILFAPSFIHTIKSIEKYSEEISLCMINANFDHSSLVQNNITDLQLKTQLGQALKEVTVEYGGLKYQIERAEQIRIECMKKDSYGILHRLWPNLAYACTGLGGSFAIHRDEVQRYCGKRLPLINLPIYSGSEGMFGFLVNSHTDEYFLLPTYAFFEFIDEEDICQIQPKTLLLSQVEPGHRYELVITTEDGLVRYRMGDIIQCTRFLSRTDNLLQLPSGMAEIPRIPLFSIVYRVGTLLNVTGEKTTEEHVLFSLQQTIHEWKQQGINVELYDFTSFPKLDAFPVHYVIFFELTTKSDDSIDTQLKKIKQSDIDLVVDRYLCKANNSYNLSRNAGKFGPAISILLRSGTFSKFQQKTTQGVGENSLQFKTRRLLKDNDHIEFFYDNKLEIFA